MPTRARIDGSRNTQAPTPPRATGTVDRPGGSGIRAAIPSRPNIAPRTAVPISTYAPAATQAPDYRVDGGYSDTGYNAMGDSSAAMAAPAQTDDQWLTTDAAFQAQLAALIRAGQDYDTDVTAQTTRYGADYNDALKSLGWNQDDVATTDVNEGAWNFKDLNTAAGRSFQNQQNDFAGRGMLQSSLYGTANDNLTRSLNDQLTGVNTAKQTFTDDLARGQASFKNENTLSQQQARAEALARRAASIV